ncbi:MAG: hypothetical protein ACREI3_04340 [Nitrospirales bacterium]
MMKGLHMLLVLGIAVGTAAGCARHHPHGMPSAAEGNREAAVERGLAEMRALVNGTVKEPAKANEVNAIAQDIVKTVQALSQESRDAHRRLYALNAEYDTEPEAFLKVLDELQTRRMQASGTILGLRFKMKGLLTREEWQKLAEGMNRYREHYQH